jgi:hypothetical protein
MRRALGLVALAVLASGGFGGSSAAPQRTTTLGDGGIEAAKPANPPQMVVDYWLGQPVRSRSAVKATCPVRADCRITRVPGDRPAEWALHVRRGLSCRPARGAYAHPGRVCLALVQYIPLTKHGSRCFCAVQLMPPGHVVGDLRGRHISVYVDFCSACGLGRAAHNDVRILTPGA